jgi:hypothetical protein
LTESPTGPATVEFSGRPIDEVKTALGSVSVEMTRLLEGRTGDDLMQPANDGGWGIVEIAPHFRDWEVVIADRVQRILAEEEPVLEEHDDSLWAIEHDYRSQDPREAMAEFRTLREALVKRVSALPDSAWLRRATIPKRGVITLHWLLDNLCDHDAKHLMQSRDVLA